MNTKVRSVSYTHLDVYKRQEIDKEEKVMNMLQLILEQQSIKFEIQNHNFNELKNDIQEINRRCENTKVECTDKINQVETKLNDSIQKTDVKFTEIDSQIDRVEKQITENNEILINTMNEHNNDIEFKNLVCGLC